MSSPRAVDCLHILVFIVTPFLAVAQAPPPARRFHPANAVATTQLRSVAALRALPGGRVIVNDVVGGRVVLLDSTLRVESVIASTAKSQTEHRPARGGLVPYLADSTLFLDVARLSMLVIDPSGHVARVVPAPRLSDFGSLTSAPAGNPGIDRRGRLVYRLGAPSRAEQLRKNRDGTAGRPDSAAIVRFDLATRHFDTAAFVRMYYPRIVSRPDAVHGGVWLSPVLNPMPVVDEWAVLSDGTLAIVRGEDYHVDYIDSANRRVSGKKIPFASVRMTLADKRSVIDSSKALRARLVAQGFRISVNAAPTAASGSPDDDAIIITDDEAKSPIEERQRPPVVYVKADELPGVQPTFTTGSVRADAGGTLWIRTIPPSPPPADATYDVLDRTGSIVDRVLVPRNTVIAGFGPSGVVYLYTRDTSGTLTLTRAHDSGRASPSSRGM